MPFNSQITRTGAGALIPITTSNEIVKNVVAKNPLLQLARRLANMPAGVTSMPVLNALATAYFVSGDTGLKQTSQLDWTNKYLHAEELAVIVPIPQNVLDDAAFDIWGEVRPAIEEAMGVALMRAILYGTNIPANWTTDLGSAGLVAGATAASHLISAAAYTDLYEAILGEKADGTDGLFMLVEADGFGVSGSVADVSMKGKLRNVRDANGQPIFKTAMQDATRYELDGTPLFFGDDGSVDPLQSLMVSGDWKQLVYSIRSDLTWTLATEGVITDASGSIIYNLFQQDMVAMRAVMRIAFALPNPISRMNPTAATRYPFAVLTA